MRRCIKAYGITAVLLTVLLTGCGTVTGQTKAQIPNSETTVETSEDIENTEPAEVVDNIEAVKEAVSEKPPSEENDEAANAEPSTPEEILKEYGKSTDLSSEDVGYIMYDADADGKEEMIITVNGAVKDVYGNYNGSMQHILSFNDDVDVTLYPEGILKTVTADSPEYTNTTWYQYYGELGDYLPMFQEYEGDYYTFCSYNLSIDELDEVEKSLKDTGYYPVWLYEWSDMIPKEEYEDIVPGTEPVALLAPDELSDMSALNIKPEYFRYVSASDGYVNLRTGPGTEYDMVCQIPNGDALEVYLKDAISASGRKWLKVAYSYEADDQEFTWLTGWVAESQLDK